MRNRFTRAQVLASAGACTTGAAIAFGVALLGQSDGHDESPDRPPEPAGSAEVREDIETAAETRNADDCARLATSGYLRQYERRSSGSAALTECRKGVFERDRGLLQSEVEIQVKAVRKADAAAFIGYREGPYGGIRARLVLLRSGNGRWVLNRITGYPFATRRQMNRVLRAEIAGGAVPFGAKAAACGVRSYEGLSDRKFELLILDGRAENVYAPLTGCARDGVVEAATRQVTQLGLVGSPGAQACVRANVARLSDPALLAFAVDPDANRAAALAAGCRA